MGSVLLPSVSSLAPAYLRHRPEQTVLYSIVSKHYPRFINVIESSGGYLPVSLALPVGSPTPGTDRGAGGRSARYLDVPGAAGPVHHPPASRRRGIRSKHSTGFEVQGQLAQGMVRLRFGRCAIAGCRGRVQWPLRPR